MFLLVSRPAAHDLEEEAADDRDVCPHGYDYATGERCQDCDEATAGDLAYHRMREG